MARGSERARKLVTYIARVFGRKGGWEKGRKGRTQKKKRWVGREGRGKKGNEGEREGGGGGEWRQPRDS